MSLSSLLYRSLTMSGRQFATVSLVLVSCVTTACSSQREISKTAEQNLTKDQALEDFDALSSIFKTLYGPKTYKEKRFGFKLDDLIAAKRTQIAAATSDVESLGTIKEFLASFHDGHVSVKFPGNATNVSAFEVPIFLTPVDGKALVSATTLTVELGVNVGDEVITIDGVKPFDLLPIIKKYEAFATELSDQHWLIRALRRPFYIKELRPTKPTASLVLGRADGSTYEIEVPWTEHKEGTNTGSSVVASVDPAHAVMDYTARQTQDLFRGISDMPQGALQDMGATEPFFNSAKVKSTFNFVRVTPSADYLTKYSLTAATAPEIFAALYKFQGKTILLVRQPGYIDDTITKEQFLNAYRAILDQYHDFADVLVIDQTHNPGGDGGYVLGFFSLFANSQANSVVQRMHADRKWLFDFRTEVADAKKANMPVLATSAALDADLVNQALDLGLDMTAPVPLEGFEHVNPDAQFTWQKPILVLADELSGSCGDIFPMLMQRNKVAKIFGHTTMGLGGNVEPLVTLPNSQAEVHVTRGLYTTFHPNNDYTDADLMENNGVQPDLPYTISVATYRGGFVDYVTAFSQAAVAQIK